MDGTEKGTAAVGDLKLLQDIADVFDRVVGLVEEFNLIEQDELTGLMAETNACDWSVDEYELESIKAVLFTTAGYVCEAKVAFGASGDMRDDAMLTATRLAGSVLVCIRPDGEVEFKDIVAELEQDQDHGR
jgi:hypothetical protein